MAKSYCSTPGCGAECQRGQLMCRSCWFAVPAKLRRAVNDTWRSYRAAEGGGDTLTAFQAYREAREAAIAAAVRVRP